MIINYGIALALVVDCKRLTGRDARVRDSHRRDDASPFALESFIKMLEIVIKIKLHYTKVSCNWIIYFYTHSAIILPTTADSPQTT